MTQICTNGMPWGRRQQQQQQQKLRCIASAEDDHKIYLSPKSMACLHLFSIAFHSFKPTYLCTQSASS